MTVPASSAVWPKVTMPSSCPAMPKMRFDGHIALRKEPAHLTGHLRRAIGHIRRHGQRQLRRVAPDVGRVGVHHPADVVVQLIDRAVGERLGRGLHRPCGHQPIFLSITGRDDDIVALRQVGQAAGLGARDGKTMLAVQAPGPHRAGN